MKITEKLKAMIRNCYLNILWLNLEINCCIAFSQRCLGGRLIQWHDAIRSTPPSELYWSLCSTAVLSRAMCAIHLLAILILCLLRTNLFNYPSSCYCVGPIHIRHSVVKWSAKAFDIPGYTLMCTTGPSKDVVPQGYNLGLVQCESKCGLCALASHIGPI